MAPKQAILDPMAALDPAKQPKTPQAPLAGQSVFDPNAPSGEDYASLPQAAPSGANPDPNAYAPPPQAEPGVEQYGGAPTPAVGGIATSVLPTSTGGAQAGTYYSPEAGGNLPKGPRYAGDTTYPGAPGSKTIPSAGGANPELGGPGNATAPTIGLPTASPSGQPTVPPPLPASASGEQGYSGPSAQLTSLLNQASGQGYGSPDVAMANARMKLAQDPTWTPERDQLNQAAADAGFMVDGKGNVISGGPLAQGGVDANGNPTKGEGGGRIVGNINDPSFSLAKVGKADVFDAAIGGYRPATANSPAPLIAGTDGGGAEARRATLEALQAGQQAPPAPMQAAGIGQTTTNTAPTPQPVTQPVTTPAQPVPAPVTAPPQLPTAAPSGGLPAGVERGGTVLTTTGDNLGLPTAGPAGGAPGAGMGSVAREAVTPENALTNTMLSRAPGADRFKIAQDQADAAAKAGEPQYQADLRKAMQKAAAGGALGSGMLQTSIGDIAQTRDVSNRANRQQLLSEALKGTISDQFGDVGIAQQQQGFQRGQQQDAFGNMIQQATTEDQLTGNEFNRALQRLQAGSTGNPADIQLVLSQIFGNQATGAGSSLAQLLGGMGNKSTSGTDSSAFTDWLRQQMGGG